MDLQLSLILIGLVILAAIVLGSIDKARLNRRFREFSRRRNTTKGVVRKALAGVERKFRFTSRLDINPGPFAEKKKKVLRADAQVERSSNKVKVDPFYEELEGFEQAASMSLNDGLDLDDTASDNGGVAQTAPSVQRTPAQQSMPDEMIDFIINLPGRGPVTRDKALGIYKQNEYLMEKPRRLYGLRYIEGVWTNLDYDPESAKYSDLMIALQLVDIAGPVDESELTTFSQLGLKLADALGRPAKHTMTFEEAMERAAELDGFCQEYDVIASINIISSNPTGFNGRDIELAATKAGMQFGAMNIFHMKNNQAMGCRHMFSMANLYAPGEFNPLTLDQLQAKGLTLFMHVPSAYQPHEVFGKMIGTAEQLCQFLGGRMMDQDNQPLSEKGLSVISAQIEDMADAMIARNVVPGSERALRLFGV